MSVPNDPSGRTAWHPLLLFVAGLLLLNSGPAQAQMNTQFGGGLQMMGSTVVQSAGPGVHLRASFPMNLDFSLAFGSTLTGFPFQGSERAAYAFDPEASIIVTLPSPSSSSPYFLGGAGWHVPIGEKRYTNRPNDEDVFAGPTFHLGTGMVWKRNAISLYVELAPTLFFRRERTAVLLPLRGGIIF